jgi:hypothetical protein
VDAFKGIYSGFIALKDLLLAYPGKTLAGLFESILPVCNAGVVKHSVDIKGLNELQCLFLSRVEAVFVSFSFQHCNTIHSIT